MILILFRKNILLQRLLSFLALLTTGWFRSFLLTQIKTDGIQTLQLGGWQAPYGVSMVADMFSCLTIVLTSSLVALCCLLFAFRSHWKRTRIVLFLPTIFVFDYRG